MMTFLNGSFWRHLCIVVRVLFNIFWWWTEGDRSGIQTHASEDTAALKERLRAIGHPPCKIKYRPTFIFVQRLHPLSSASLEVIPLCHLPFHGFFIWLKVNSRVCYEICLQVRYSFPPLLCLSIAPFKRLGRSPRSRGWLLCHFLAYTVWQTLNIGNNIELVAPCELMMTFLTGNLRRRLCIVILV